MRQDTQKEGPAGHTQGKCQQEPRDYRVPKASHQVVPMTWDKRAGTWNWERETTRLTTLYAWDILLPILRAGVLFLVDFLESLHILATNPLASYRYNLCLLHSGGLFSFSDVFCGSEVSLFHVLQLINLSLHS